MIFCMGFSCKSFHFFQNCNMECYFLFTAIASQYLRVGSSTWVDGYHLMRDCLVWCMEGGMYCNVLEVCSFLEPWELPEIFWEFSTELLERYLGYLRDTVNSCTVIRTTALMLPLHGNLWTWIKCQQNLWDTYDH